MPGDFDSLVAQAFGPGTNNSYQLDIASTDLAEYYSNLDLYSTTVVGMTWVHVAGTWDGGTKRIYVNGALEGQMAAGPVVFDTTPLTLACDLTNNLSDHFFQGGLADVVLYDRTLSDQEIQLLAGS